MPCCDGHPHGLPRRVRLSKGVSRRDLLRWTLGGAGIAALGPWIDRRLPVASGAPLGHKFLVVLYLDGGADTLNMVVPKTLSNYYSLRPTIAVPAGTELPLQGSTLYGFHPNLPRLKAMYDAGDVSVVHRVGYPNGDQSHFLSQDIFNYAVRGDFISLGVPQSGWIARYAENFAPTPMGAVSIGMGRPTAFVGGASNPLQVSSLNAFRFASDPASNSNHVHRLNTIQGILAQSSGAGTPGEVKDALDQALSLSDQVQDALTNFQSGVTYPSGSPARTLRDAAVLIQAGFETRVFYMGFGGFDTHSDQESPDFMPALLTRLDGGLDAFRQDMVAMGQWDNTVVAVVTEFGRRNYENGSRGLDHGHAFSLLLVGGGVNGGFYGPNLTTGDLNQEVLPYAVDFRDVYKELVVDHLGGGAAPVFPEPQPTNTVLGVV